MTPHFPLRLLNASRSNRWTRSPPQHAALTCSLLDCEPLAMIEAKASGAVVDVIEAPVKDTTVSLLDALEASISGKGMK